VTESGPDRQPGRADAAHPAMLRRPRPAPLQPLPHRKPTRTTELSDGTSASDLPSVWPAGTPAKS